MSRPDPVAGAALEQDVIRPKWFAHLDFVNEPVRANTTGADISFSGTGNPDFDGHTFMGISADFVDIGSVRAREGGSDQVVAKLSALIDLDNDMLNEIGDRSNWIGRTARLWRIIHDKDDVQQGGIQHYYTGHMVDLSIKPAPKEQLLSLVIESWLSAFSQPSNRDYNQSRYDPNDKSYEAAIAIANGNSGNPITNNTPTNGGGGALEQHNFRSLNIFQ